MSPSKPPLKPSPPQPKQVQSELEPEEEGGGKGLPILLAIVVIGVIAYMFVQQVGDDPERGACQEAVPSESSGRCPDSRHAVFVEDGVAICRCPPEETP